MCPVHKKFSRWEVRAALFCNLQFIISGEYIEDEETVDLFTPPESAKSKLDEEDDFVFQHSIKSDEEYESEEGTDSSFI